MERLLVAASLIVVFGLAVLALRFVGRRKQRGR